MKPRVRAAFYWLFGAVFLVVACAGAVGLPQFGSFSHAYSSRVLNAAPKERHIQNIATAVNFDYRGFDTLGEEFIFFTSVTGVLFMLSSLKGKTQARAEAMEPEESRGQNGAIRWFPTGLTAFIAAMAMDIGAHGQLTPGGGFQGGAIFGSAMACVYLGVGFNVLQRVVRKELFDSMEALGSFAYASLGVATGAVSGYFLKNILPLGQYGGLVSSGTIYFISCAVFVEIACGFTVLVLVFLRQTRQAEEPE